MTIVQSNPCDHFETNTQPEECEDCVCADCGAWVGSVEIRQCGGLCEECLAKGLGAVTTAPSANQLAEITEAELAGGLTAIQPPAPGDRFAVSANSHWDYEQRSATRWAIWDRRADKLFGYDDSPNAARRQTFEQDHPLHDHPRPEPGPVHYTVD